MSTERVGTRRVQRSYYAECLLLVSTERSTAAIASLFVLVTVGSCPFQEFLLQCITVNTLVVPTATEMFDIFITYS